jgi:glycosyltransferase involved in cell wall biosynthesis
VSASVSARSLDGTVAAPAAGAPVALSLVVPLWNERESLAPLKSAIDDVLRASGADASGTGASATGGAEIIFVDDGSTDGSWGAIEEIAAADPRVRAVRFRRNYGKAAALAVGFSVAQGESVVTLDADLQDDPKEIPALLAKLAEGCDVVSGWKKKRRDPLSKTIPSLFFNRVVSVMTRVPIHDMNCGLKAYRRDVVKELELYGELHRYIPALAARRGYRIGEIPVEHHPRRHGRSKYGAWRFVAGFLDLLTIMMISRFTLKPLHFFGSIGLVFGFFGCLVNLYLVGVRLQYGNIQGRTPLLMLGVLLIIVGIQLMSTGLLAELIARSLSRSDPPYSVERRIRA